MVVYCENMHGGGGGAGGQGVYFDICMWLTDTILDWLYEDLVDTFCVVSRPICYTIITDQLIFLENRFL